MGTSTETVREFRRRQKLRGKHRLNVYISPEDKKIFDEFAEKFGGQEAALKKLIEQVGKSRQAA